jgi:hypothetical protein
MERYARGENGVRAEELDVPEANERRRVIKALSSIPVLLTLGSGVARARDSTYQCVTTTPQPSNAPILCSQNSTKKPSCDTRPPPWKYDPVPDGLGNGYGCSSPDNYAWQCKYVCFDDNGTPLEASADCSRLTPPGYAVTNSCYASFPTAPG